jgi:hypothetical protein
VILSIICFLLSTHNKKLWHPLVRRGQRILFLIMDLTTRNSPLDIDKLISRIMHHSSPTDSTCTPNSTFDMVIAFALISSLLILLLYSNLTWFNYITLHLNIDWALLQNNLTHPIYQKMKTCTPLLPEHTQQFAGPPFHPFIGL